MAVCEHIHPPTVNPAATLAVNLAPIRAELAPPPEASPPATVPTIAPTKARRGRKPKAARPEPMPEAWRLPVPLPAQAVGTHGAQALAPHERAVIDAGLAILEFRLREPSAVLTAPQQVRELLRLRLVGLEREEFHVLFLDAQHGLIAAETVALGTLTQTSVYPREVVRRALAWNAAAVVLAHNHPSGVAEPSRADEHLTQCLRQALAVVDVRVLDHFIVGHHTITSMAERGLV